MSLSFHHFLHEFGEAGARERFDTFVVATVKSVRPSARPVRANPGDWGIDVYVGSLAQGQVAVWQAKFFLTDFGDSQKDQVRKAYKSARKAATAEGYKLLSWTLCLPQDLDGPAQKWWDDWSGERKREDCLEVDLWNLAEFRTLLAKPDAADVRLEYFPHLPPVHQPQAPAIEAVPDSASLDDLLFVVQLREAGLIEVDSAKEQFYNAELVGRDLADKGLLKRLEAFAGLRADLRSVWEDRFNYHSGAVIDGRALPDLHPDVMDRVDRAHDASPREPFPLGRTHRKGVLHQVVERGEAGWVRDFRDVAEAHRAG
ncbi:MAG: hypothetical protein ITG02_15170 [Patulibacter sp.]|nr:hypothetical protein [Patulibacter sp.]